MSGAERYQAKHRAHKRGFPRAIRAQYANELARSDIESHALQHKAPTQTQVYVMEGNGAHGRVARAATSRPVDMCIFRLSDQCCCYNIASIGRKREAV
jgi:hypothetical protein